MSRCYRGGRNNSIIDSLIVDDLIVFENGGVPVLFDDTGLGIGQAHGFAPVALCGQPVGLSSEFTPRSLSQQLLVADITERGIGRRILSRSGAIETELFRQSH